MGVRSPIFIALWNRALTMPDLVAGTNKSSRWRNWLARTTVNREVESSILSRDVHFLYTIWCCRRP
ncbi:similar to An16g01890 [Aspergillus luchuensis]|uniref:Similar to An16g01890 n=1 Tax=Aspergillus kawachii TaxID=1069201 RepID=A0A146FM85_ASPKA|nr:similar to An16g01890 [Aspergillus luchuensis]